MRPRRCRQGRTESALTRREPPEGGPRLHVDVPPTTAQGGPAVAWNVPPRAAGRTLSATTHLGERAEVAGSLPLTSPTRSRSSSAFEGSYRLCFPLVCDRGVVRSQVGHPSPVGMTPGGGR